MVLPAHPALPTWFSSYLWQQYLLLGFSESSGQVVVAREQSLDSHSKETEKTPGPRIGTKEDPEEAGRAAGQPPVGLS